MELPLGLAVLGLLLDLLLTDSGSINKKVRHFMFLPLASTMSVVRLPSSGDQDMQRRRACAATLSG